MLVFDRLQFVAELAAKRASYNLVACQRGWVVFLLWLILLHYINVLWQQLMREHA